MQEQTIEQNTMESLKSPEQEGKTKADKLKNQRHTYNEWQILEGVANKQGEQMMSMQDYLQQKKKERLSGIVKGITSAGGSVGKAVFNRIGQNFDSVQGFSGDGGIVQQQVKGMTTGGGSSGFQRIAEQQNQPADRKARAGKKPKKGN